MIRNVWSVLCRDIITDQETNSVTYVRCIEEGSALEVPVRIGPIFLGTLWEKNSDEKESVQFRVILEMPDQSLRPILQTKPMVLERPRHRLHFRINSLDITSFGLHYVLVEFNQEQNWRHAVRIPVFIRKIQKKESVSV
ncbi:hypothetical protein [Desulfonatronospira sp.]|uniref:hypothetical protein n=1 Tax=Desulfonatronospira sp. TaxID=1962951 RepID=UPI0025C13243|nr:hypothetical protein [Desulfonatronospira sp.]